MKPSQLTTWKVQKLREHLNARRFAVPKLQRNFVWDPNRAAKLIDSIYKAIPIGSLFLWQMDKKSANLIRQSANVLPAFNSVGNPHIWFIIDGQQRLSVIHQAFEGESKKNDAGREIQFSRLCFVVNPEPKHEGQDNPARIAYRKPDDRDYISLRDVLHDRWRSRMPIKTKGFLAKIMDCRNRLLNYTMPIVIVESATLEEIGEVFIRVNAQGMKITNVDRALALMGNLDVGAMTDELREKIRQHGFALTDRNALLMGFNLINERPAVDSDPPKLEAMARRLSKSIQQSETKKQQFKKEWDHYRNAVLKAIDYLRGRCYVYDESYLPSSNMIATLAVFFYHHPGQPSTSQAKEIRKWFWATGVAQRYSGGGYHSNLVSDANLFEALAHGKQKYFTLKHRVEPDDLLSHQYSAQSARSRAFFCLLASLKPRYLDSDEQLSLANRAISPQNATHRHHVFPKTRLNDFPAKARNSLCNICFLVATDNLEIGMKLPRTYLADYRRNGKQAFQRAMKSHLIPVKDTSGVWNRSLKTAFKQFRRERLSLICSAFEQAARMKLFAKP